MRRNGYDRLKANIVFLSIEFIAIFFFSFAFYLGGRMDLRPIAEHPLIRFLSSVSYEIYLIHYIFLNGLFSAGRLVSNEMFSDAIVAVLSVFLAWPVHLGSDYLMQRLRRHDVGIVRE